MSQATVKKLNFPLLNVVVTKVNEVSRADKSTLYFAEFANPDTFQNTGTILVFANDDQLKELYQGNRVNIDLNFGQNGGRTIVNVCHIEQAK